jgi:hypothetical protein
MGSTVVEEVCRMNEKLERDLGGMRRRIRLLLTERYALLFGAVAIGIAAVILALSKLCFSFGQPLVLSCIVATGLVFGACWGLFRRITPFATARATEKRLDLKERLSSAVALSDSDDEMVKALIDDAACHIDGVKPREVFPHRFTREMSLFGVAFFLLLGLFLVPQMPSLQSQTRREEVKVMKREGHRLRKLASQTLKKVSPENKKIAMRVALNMEKLGKKLETGRMTRKQALLDMSKLDKQIKDTQDRIAARNRSPKSLAQAGRDMQNATHELARKMQDMLDQEMKQNSASGKQDKKLEDLQKRLKDLQSSKGLSDEKIQQMEKQVQDYLKSQEGVPVPPELAAVMANLMKNGDYQKASQLMAELAKKLGQNGNKMSKMDSKMLEEQMKAMAEALKNTDLNELAKAMREAAEKLAKMNPEEAAKLMAQAAKMGKMAKMSSDMEAMKKAGAG